MDIFEKITFIPGWMDRPKFHKNLKGLDIWAKKVAENTKIKTEYVLAHSLGCNFALRNWMHNQNCQLILVNPTLGSRTFGESFRKWYEYFWEEGRKVGTLERSIFCLLTPLTLPRVNDLISTSVEELLGNVPKEKVTIVTGEKDRYFCAREDVEKLEKREFRVLKIKDMIHDFRSKDGGMIRPLEEVLKKIIE